MSPAALLFGKRQPQAGAAVFGEVFDPKNNTGFYENSRAIYTEKMQTLYGIHPVEEALKAGKRRFDHVLVARERRDERLEAIVSLCRALKIRVSTQPREALTDMARTPSHQGVVAIVRAQQFLTIEDVLEPAESHESSSRLVLALDGIEDPQNLGALLRSADGAGVDAVVMTERRAAPLSAVAAKAAAGAQEHLRIARVVNLVRSLEQLKQSGIWIIGLDERGTTDYDQFDFTGNCALVMGREGEGLHDLVRKTCDHLLRIPMAGGVSSLNVSAAGAVVLFEAYRQRRNKARTKLDRASRNSNSLDDSPQVASKPKKLKGLGS